MSAVSSQEGTENVLLMVTGVRKVWNTQWEHGLWTGIGLRNLHPGWEKLKRIQWQCGLRYWWRYQFWSVLLLKLFGFCLLSVERFEVYPFPQRNIPWLHVQRGTHWNWSPSALAGARRCSRAVPWGAVGPMGQNSLPALSPALLLLTEPNQPTTLP